MSTYCYFECLDHEPPLRSVEEFTQHVGDDAWNAGIRQALSRPVPDDGPAAEFAVKSYWDPRAGDDYFAWNAWRFLRQHQTCRVGVITEYGMRHDLPEPTKEEDHA